MVWGRAKLKADLKEREITQRLQVDSHRAWDGPNQLVGTSKEQ